MTKMELVRAVEIARDGGVSLADVDHSPLCGLATRDFVSVVTTVKVVAKMVRELAVRFDGSVDEVELSEFARLARHRVTLVG